VTQRTEKPVKYKDHSDNEHGRDHDHGGSAIIDSKSVPVLPTPGSSPATRGVLKLTLSGSQRAMANAGVTSVNFEQSPWRGQKNGFDRYYS
jgi:hypothetical protein